MFAAHARGLRQVILGARYRIFHIDHSIGSGWSPAGGDLLFARLRARAIPYLSDDELRHWRVKFADDPDSAIINGVDWGLGERELPERRILPHGRRAAARGGCSTGSAGASRDDSVDSERCVRSRLSIPHSIEIEHKRGRANPRLSRNL